MPHGTNQVSMDGRFLKSLVATALLTLFATASAFAQNFDPIFDLMVGQIRRQSPEFFNLISEDKLKASLTHIATSWAKGETEKLEKPLDISSDNISPEVHSFLMQQAKKHGSLQALQEARTEAKQALPQTVVGHVTSGATVGWPTVQEVKATHYQDKKSVLSPAEFDAISRIAKARVDAEARKAARLNQDDEIKSIVPKIIPACPKNASRTMNYGKPNPREPVEKDVLFIRHEVPSVVDEIFGRMVEVHRYTGDPNDPDSKIIASMGVPCLPYRMRASENISIQDFGLNALMNYSDDLLNRGELHGYVKDNQERLLR